MMIFLDVDEKKVKEKKIEVGRLMGFYLKLDSYE